MSDLATHNAEVEDFLAQHKGMCVRLFPDRVPFWALADWARTRNVKLNGKYLPSLFRTDGALDENDGRNQGYGIPFSYNIENQLEDAKEKFKDSKKKESWGESSWIGQVELEGYQQKDDKGELRPVKVVVRSFLIPGGDGYRYGVLVATPDAKVMSQFMSDLTFYDDARFDQKRKYISVWRGQNILRPSLTWDDLCLSPVEGNSLRSQVEAFFNSRERYKQLGLPYRRGFLLVGPPGNGKTTACKVIAAQYPQYFFLIVPVTRQTDDHDIKQAMDFAAKQGPSVVLLEDLDKMNFEKVPISSFLNMLDGFETKEGVLLLATSNEPDKLDPALSQRPSRFDRVFAFTKPGVDQRKALLTKRSMGRYDADEIADVAKKTEGMTMAYVQEVVVNALLQAIHKNREPKRGDLQRSLLVLQQQQKQVKGIYDTGVPEEKKLGFSQSPLDDENFDPWDEDRPLPGGWS